MIKIAHRGNWNGREETLENTIVHLRNAELNGFNVEVDVTLKNGQWVLGHDTDQEIVELEYLLKPSVWAHAKTIDTYFALIKFGVHAFWHDKDEYIFTSRNIKWARSNVWTNDGIMVMPDVETIELINNGIINPLGVCMDNFLLLKR